MITELTNHCLSCLKPLCETGCPAGNHICSYIKAIKNGDLAAAADILYSADPFPELTSRLCDCTRQCQGQCVRGIKGEPVSNQMIERYISDHSERHITTGTPNGRSCALIGAGPACLAAAVDLLQAGYHVEIYEQLNHVGGAVYSGIPSYRFDKKYLDNIQKELSEAGVIFHLSCEVGKDITFAQLEEQFDQILVGIGAAKENTYGLSGEGCIAGLSLLYDLNVKKAERSYKEKYKSAIVWGGGNVAMDCARSLQRILHDVTVIYRRTEKEMPANLDEIEDAKKEGVKFAFLENIKGLNLDENGRVISASCIKMHLGEPDSSGRARPIETEGSEYILPCELVVPAIGQAVDLSIFSLEKTESHHTNKGNVFVCGDAYLGPKTVAAAIHDGKAAAAEMLKMM